MYEESEYASLTSVNVELPSPIDHEEGYPPTNYGFEILHLSSIFLYTTFIYVYLVSIPMENYTRNNIFSKKEVWLWRPSWISRNCH